MQTCSRLSTVLPVTVQSAAARPWLPRPCRRLCCRLRLRLTTCPSASLQRWLPVLASERARGAFPSAQTPATRRWQPHSRPPCRAAAGAAAGARPLSARTGRQTLSKTVLKPTGHRVPPARRPGVCLPTCLPGVARRHYVLFVQHGWAVNQCSCVQSLQQGWAVGQFSCHPFAAVHAPDAAWQRAAPCEQAC